MYFPFSFASGYLAIMQNNFDSDAVSDEICEQASLLMADCSSCSCCESCCDSKDMDNEENRLCYFDLDFHQLAGLTCGAWWADCSTAIYDTGSVD